MRRRLILLTAVPVLALVAFASSVQAQSEGGSVLFEGDIYIDCRVAFEDFEQFQDDPPDTRNEQRDFEEAQGYVQLCTERGVVPPFDKAKRPLPTTGGFSPLFVLGIGGSVLVASLVVGGLLVRRMVR
jgi:hypothetical protein